jgi:glycosyltransferase involved in cell wall biosynthesis
MSGAKATTSGELLYVVMPIYNEQESIGEVVREWKACLDRLAPDHRILILNDGSKDNTAAVLADIAAATPGVEVVNKPNSGHGRTCIHGYREAITRGAKWIFQIDSDGQCDPQYFEAVWNQRHQYASVFGKRVDRDDGLARKVISLFCRAATHIATGVPVRDPNVPYRLMRADVLARAIADFPQDFGLSNILVSVVLQKGLGSQMGFQPIGFRDRTGGEPSVKWMKFVTEGSKLYAGLMAKRPFISARAADVASALRPGS